MPGAQPPAQLSLSYDYDRVIAVGNLKNMEIIATVKDGKYIYADPNGSEYVSWHEGMADRIASERSSFFFFSKGRIIGKGTIQNTSTSPCDCVSSDVMIAPPGFPWDAEHENVLAVISKKNLEKHSERWIESKGPVDKKIKEKLNSAVKAYVVKTAEEREKWYEPLRNTVLKETDVDVVEKTISTRSFYLTGCRKKIFLVSLGASSVVIRGTDNKDNWNWLEPVAILFEKIDGKLQVLKELPSENGIRLIDLFDFDGDKIPELVFLEEWRDGYEFEIYKYSEGKLILVAESSCGC